MAKFLFGMIEKTEEDVEQAGVKGMRWGFRKPGTRGSTPPSKRKAKGSEDDKVDAPAKPKTVKGMSDQELRDAINRLQAEKTYAQLTTPQKSQNVVAEVLKNSTKAIATQVITQVGTAYLKQAIGVNLDKVLPAQYASAKALKDEKPAEKDNKKG